MFNRVPSPLTLLAAAATTFCGGAHAVGIDPDPAPIAEIVVSALRTPEVASRIPVAMTVLTGEQLTRDGIERPADLARRLPNVSMDGAADGLKITIRGVTSADTTEKGDPSAAVMQDGIYIARPQSQDAALFDIERVEVLRGPQGTLYGRNATAGVMNIVSRVPTHILEGSAGAEIGNFNARRLDAMLNVPVNASLALRAALSARRHDSYLANGQGTPYTLGLDRDDRAARLSAKLDLGTDASLVLRYDLGIQHDNPDNTVQDGNFYTGVATGKPVATDHSTAQRLTNTFIAPNGLPEQAYRERRSSGIGADLRWKLGTATLYYLGSRRHFDDDFLTNYYYRVAPTLALGVRETFTGAYTQDSHELRLASDASAVLSGQAGLYYFREKSDVLYGFRDLEPLGLPPYYVFPHGPNVARSKAVFGQGTWRVADALRATLGARYTDDVKSRVGSTNFQQTATFNAATDLRLLNAAAIETSKTTWRAGLDYDLAPGTLLYGAVSTGYKAGGFNDGCLAGTRALGVECPAAQAVPESTLVYRPETLTAFEAGVKTRFLDRRATLNLTAFHYHYDNLQLSGVAVVQGAPRYVTSNAGQASVTGVEADGAVKLGNDGTLQYGLTWLDAHYVTYVPDGVHSLAGQPLDRSPARTLTLGYDHRFGLAHGELLAGIATRASAAYLISVPSQLLAYRVAGHTSTDLSLHWQATRAPWQLQLRVRNLENAVRPIAIDSFGMVVPSDPRSLNARLAYRF
ncbi:TonB-dependent receptor [Massilia sp. S19_KUP03_FR1]|uniref:TonB-dependent receptor n=1 Tax=Massilia sp. S19_KUP03_FR1 TaxID=3025503 RepID=UPI002FCCCE24